MGGTTDVRSNGGAGASDGTPMGGAESLDLPARVAELERRINTTSESTGRRDQSTGWQDWIAATTLIALVVYGSARFGDAAFYARLGTDPDAVGLNYGVTLSRVATTIGVTGAGVLACLLYGRFLQERKKAADERGEPAADKRSKWAALCITMYATGLLLLGIATAFLIMLILPYILFWYVRIILAVLVVLFLFWVGYKSAGYKFRAPESGSVKSHVYLGVAIATVVLFAISGFVGYNSASYIMRGKVLPCSCLNLFSHNMTLPWSTGSSGFLGLEADYARVIWVGTGRGMAPVSAIFLGGSNGDVVLFDFIAHRLLVVPSSDVIVRTEGNLIGWNE